jgi:hypothetical protein
MLRLRSRKRVLVVVVVVLGLVGVAAIPRGGGLPPFVPNAHAASCRLITIYGREKSTVGLVQYKLKERAYWCASSGRVTYYAVSLAVTYTGPFWSVSSSETNSHWLAWNGKLHGSRYVWKQKTMEGCITNVGGCLKTKHPWIELELRANLAMTLNWNTRDLTITRVEI